MSTETYISDVKQRKINITLVGLGIVLGVFISFLALNFSPARAERDVIGEVKHSNKEAFDVLHSVGECLRESIGKVDYVKAELHENNMKLDF